MEKIYRVSEQMSAKNMGSGDLQVLSTPSLCALVENFCKEQIKLEENQTSVGIFFEISHLKASKLNEDILIKILNMQKEDRKYSFDYEVYLKDKLLAKGEHKRIVVELEKFLAKL